MGMNSGVSELSGAHKYLVHYVDLDLSQWGIEKGNGRVTLNVDKRGKRTQITSRLDVRNMISNGAPIEGFNATVNSLNSRVAVDFGFTDSDLTGKAALRKRPGEMKIDFTDVRGDTRKIFQIPLLASSATAFLKTNSATSRSFLARYTRPTSSSAAVLCESATSTSRACCRALRYSPCCRRIPMSETRASTAAGFFFR